jgi:hypothetical protein
MKFLLEIAVLLSLLATGLFVRGFFLMRRELHNVSICDPESLRTGLPNYSTEEENALFDIWVRSAAQSAGCWAPPKHKRVFLFIVDALRLDFMTAPLDPDGEALMPRMHELLQRNATQTRLFGFRADPPTVTAQRLKGLTAGSLPTFVDIGANFNSSEVLEDTWLTQLRQRRDSTHSTSDVFMGDDTWLELFPGRFEKALPFPSFDTHDLHTVDDGIEAAMLPTLLHDRDNDVGKRGTLWDVFVAHFLGVDHIGHTHHAWHPLMAPRLNRMDRLLSEVAEALPSDALLLVFGDHGMSDDGNHGGASREETDSGLFVYSKEPFDLAPDTEWYPGQEARSPWQVAPVQSRASLPRMVSQVDLVPTLSLLLGIPVPYSSMGGIIPELLVGQSPGTLSHSLLANSLQVLRYVRRLGQEGADVSPSVLHDLEHELYTAMHMHYRLLSGEDDEEGHANVNVAYKRFLDSALELGRSIFTEFDLPLMTIGVVLLVIALALLAAPVVVSRAAEGRHFKVKDPASVYVAAVLVWALVHAAAGISDNGIHLEPTAHAVAVIILAILGQRAMAARFDSPNGMLQAGVAVWACVLLPRWVGPVGALARGATYTVSSALICLFVLRCVPIELGKLLSKVSALLLLLSCSLAGVVFVVEPGSVVGVLAARASLGLSLLCVVGLILLTKGTLHSAWYIHAAAHSCCIISVVTGPLLLPLILAFGLHIFHGTTGVLYCFPPKRRDRVPINDAKILAMAGAVHLATVIRTTFFASGHRLSFGALQADAGLVGAHSFSYYWAGLLLTVNSFGMEFLCIALCIPWLAIVQRDMPRQQCERLLLHTLALYRVLVLLGSCLTAYQLRRHLMVWAVFAPKLAFEAAFWVVQGATIFIVSCSSHWKYHRALVVEKGAKELD